MSDAGVETQRELIDAFLTAARDGDFEALLEVLDPDVVLRTDGPAASRVVRGAETVARQARSYSQLGLVMRPALVNGAAGAVTLLDGKPFAVAAVTVRNRRIVAMDFLADPELLARLHLTILDD